MSLVVPSRDISWHLSARLSFNWARKPAMANIDYLSYAFFPSVCFPSLLALCSSDAAFLAKAVTEALRLLSLCCLFLFFGSSAPATPASALPKFFMEFLAV